MRRSRLVSLVALGVGAVAGFAVGCDPYDPNAPAPPSLSDRVCYSDSDCMANACCGEGTNPTHVQDGPDCTNVRCDGSCTPGTIDCGRCIPICRDSRCTAACQG